MSFESLKTIPENNSIEPEERMASLTEQFDDTEKVEINGEQFDVVDIRPEELKTETPTVYVPGFSATPEALKDAILKTAEAGRRVVSAYAPHGVDGEMEHPELPDIEVRKLELFLKLIESKDLDKVNVIANSEAAIYVTAAAVLFPDKFENIVLIDPAGIIGKDNSWQLLKRVILDAIKEGQMKKDVPSEVTRADFPASISVGAKSILSNLRASLKEVQAIAHSDITEALKEIHDQGIGVSIIHGADDLTFPMEKVQEMVTKEMLDGFYSVWGTHNNIYQYEPYGRAAEAALSALEKKKDKN